MNDYLATITLENDEETDDLEQAIALQQLINSGTVWHLQGAYGRAAMDAIESGVVMLGRSPSLDYWRNRIPARHEVQEGTKGSRQFVADARGEEWASALEAVGLTQGQRHNLDQSAPLRE